MADRQLIRIWSSKDKAREKIAVGKLTIPSAYTSAWAVALESALITSGA
jgi:hypothetical protein